MAQSYMVHIYQGNRTIKSHCTTAKHKNNSVILNRGFLQLAYDLTFLCSGNVLENEYSVHARPQIAPSTFVRAEWPHQMCHLLLVILGEIQKCTWKNTQFS